MLSNVPLYLVNLAVVRVLRATTVLFERSISLSVLGGFGKFPDGTVTLTRVTNIRKKLVTCVWCSNDMFHYMFKAEFVTLVSLKVPSGLEEEKRVFLHLQEDPSTSSPEMKSISPSAST